MKVVRLLVSLGCFAASMYGQSFYRYLDLTPVMDLLPRAEIDSALAADMTCFRLTVSGDTLDVVKLHRGVPIPVYDFAEGFSVTSTDSAVVWVDKQDNSSGYTIELNKDGLPALVSRFDGVAFQEWVWMNDSTVVSYQFDSLGNRESTDVTPNYTETAIRLDENGDLEYFKYETISASGWQYTLNSSHRAVCRKAVDAAGEIVSTSDGVFETRYCYDASGNLTSTRLIGSGGSLLLNDYSTAVTGNYTFDEDGMVVNEEKVAFTEQLFDENFLYILERHYGTDGNFTENFFGVASITFQRDIRGGISESVWLDRDGNRTEIEGISVTRRLFNKHGRVLESSTYNAALEIADFSGGFAYTRFSYTEGGQTELISYYNSTGMAVINSSLGCHARSFVYDAHGRCTEVRYLDRLYNLIDLATGYARVVSVFDKDGNLMEHIFFDKNGTVLP